MKNVVVRKIKKVVVVSGSRGLQKTELQERKCKEAKVQ